MGLKRSLSYVLMIMASACGDDGGHKQNDAPPGDGGRCLQRPSRSSTIALADDGAHVAMVNPDDGSLSVFETSDNSRTAKVATGARPGERRDRAGLARPRTSSNRARRHGRARHRHRRRHARGRRDRAGRRRADRARAVADRQAAVRRRVRREPRVGDRHGDDDGDVSRSPSIARARSLVTNNGDTNDDDETLIVAAVLRHAGRRRRSARTTAAPATSGCASLARPRRPPKDISARADRQRLPGRRRRDEPDRARVAEPARRDRDRNGRVYVTSVAASPEGPTRFDNNVFPVVYVADLATRDGSARRERHGQPRAQDLRRDPEPVGDEPALHPGRALRPRLRRRSSNVAYAIGRAGDVMVRVTFGDDRRRSARRRTRRSISRATTTIGQCQAPTGVAIDHGAQRAYVNCWVTRRLGVVDLASADADRDGRIGAAADRRRRDQSAQRGKRFYFTGRARWSAAVANGAKGGEGWSSCGSCHPDGLTDNITWSFNAGPRQTTSQDGTFSHGAGAQKQRMLNWTAIFDEHHDFERNTRDVSGGLGAITTAASLADCGQLDKETQVDLKPGGVAIGGLAEAAQGARRRSDRRDVRPQGLGRHRRATSRRSRRSTRSARPIRRGRARSPAVRRRRLREVPRRRGLDGVAPVLRAGEREPRPRSRPRRSRARRSSRTTWMYDNGATPAHADLGAAGDRDRGRDRSRRARARSRSARPRACCATSARSACPATRARPTRSSCASLNGARVRAEGRAGFNVPSLYGLALGAPYLHHGQAPTLTICSRTRAWGFHTNAGNANFSVDARAAPKLDDLIAFLLSIDATTPEIDAADRSGQRRQLRRVPRDVPLASDPVHVSRGTCTTSTIAARDTCSHLTSHRMPDFWRSHGAGHDRARRPWTYQHETDRYWHAIVSNGGTESASGWSRIAGASPGDHAARAHRCTRGWCAEAGRAFEAPIP